MSYTPFSAEYLSMEQDYQGLSYALGLSSNPFSMVTFGPLKATLRHEKSASRRNADEIPQLSTEETFKNQT